MDFEGNGESYIDVVLRPAQPPEDFHSISVYASHDRHLSTTPPARLRGRYIVHQPTAKRASFKPVGKGPVSRRRDTLLRPRHA